MRVKVSLMGDVCAPVPLSMTIHDGACVEMATPLMWPPGFALQQNKLTTTVFHKSQFIVLGDHDCGHVIPHVTIPLTNPKLALYIAFSKRKVMFAASKVKANGSQVGCTELIGFHVPLPMLCCGSPVSLPNGFPMFNWLNTVSVGLSLGDVLAGFVAIAIDVFGKLLCNLKWFRGGYDGFVKEMVGAANLKQWALKNALASLSGAAKLVLTREGKYLRVELGSGYAGFQVSWKRSPEDRMKAERQHQVGPVQVVLAHSDRRDGTTSDQSTVNEGTPTGTRSSQLAKTYDGKGNLLEQKTQTTATGDAVDVLGDGASDMTAVSRQHTTTLQANGHATSTAVTYAGSPSPAASWGMPL
jgi:hypothetical protein